MAVDIENTWVEKLGYVEFTINSSVNILNSKAPFELVYGTNVQTVVDQLNGVHYVENIQQLATHIKRLITEAKE